MDKKRNSQQAPGAAQTFSQSPPKFASGQKRTQRTSRSWLQDKGHGVESVIGGKVTAGMLDGLGAGGRLDIGVPNANDRMASSVDALKSCIADTCKKAGEQGKREKMDNGTSTRFISAAVR